MLLNYAQSTIITQQNQYIPHYKVSPRSSAAFPEGRLPSRYTCERVGLWDQSSRDTFWRLVAVISCADEQRLGSTSILRSFLLCLRTSIDKLQSSSHRRSGRSFCLATPHSTQWIFGASFLFSSRASPTTKHGWRIHCLLGIHFFAVGCGYIASFVKCLCRRFSVAHSTTRKAKCEPPAFRAT